MDPTRRARLYAALAVALAIVAVVVADPRPLLGAVGLGAALVAVQIDAVATFRAAPADIEISVTPGSTHTRVGHTEPITVHVERSRTDTPLAVTLQLPVGVDGPDERSRTLHVAPGESSGTLSVDAEFTTAGAFTIPPVEAHLRDTLGFFAERVPFPHQTTITAEPTAVSQFHVGRAGNRLASAYGEHPSDETGAGLTPAELRQYVAGDPAHWIDWKSTARLSEPYIREFEIETDRQTALFVDTRTGGNSRGETASSPNVREYLREAALAIAAVAEVNSDPLGLWTVDSEGYTRVEANARSPKAYTHVRDVITDIPAQGAQTTAGTHSLRRPADAVQTARSLGGDDSPFARTLTAYTATVEAYVTHVTDDPLFEAVRDAGIHGGNHALTVVVSDDSRPQKLLETVKFATRGGNHALVLCAPRVLFESGSLADLDDAYQRYRAFENYRRDLEQMPNVTALEIGPEDRIDALLAAHRAGDQR